MPKKIIYLDNNGTTRTCDVAARVMTDWIQSCSNPSGSSWLSQASKMLIEKAQASVAKINHLKNDYYVIFTSGASESNCTIIQMVVNAWYAHSAETKPHIVTTSVEHKSVLSCLMNDRVDATFVEPNMYGVVDPADIEAAIRPNTVLVTVMFANNETGAINHVRRMAEIAHARGVPFHTDAVQIYGKLEIDIPTFGIDALSMSFHKLYGPMACGMLIVRKAFVDGYELKGVIAGSQQYGLRGGTEGVPNIAGGIAALVENFRSRDKKNAHLEALRHQIIKALGAKLPIIPYDQFYDTDDNPQPTPKTRPKGKALCILGPPETQKNNRLPNTILLSIIDYDHDFCNVKFKKQLETAGVIVSIGSACNTASKSASHVLEALRAPAIVKRGIIRISLGDLNTKAEVAEFCKIFLSLLGKAPQK
jgi:cysteine desulfurase